MKRFLEKLPQGEILDHNHGQVSHLSMVKTKLEQTLDELEDNLDR